jgi:Zn-dependent protease with chaperone function
MANRRFVPGIVLLLLLAAAAISPAADASSQPTPGAAPEARLDDPAFLARARAYTTGNYWSFLADEAVNFLVLAWLAFSGVSSLAWRWIVSRAGAGAAGTLLYIAGLAVFLSIVSSPLDFYDGFVREHAYGFSTQTIGAWAADRVLGLVVVVPVAALVIVPIFAAIRRFPVSWWILGTALGCVVAIVLVVVDPVFLAPLYNKFTPIQDQDLRKTILDLAHEHGVPAKDVYEMDASKRTVHDNAYASGLLGTERIVLYDTLLEGYAKDEIAFVMAHEIGHRVLHHIWKGLALACALILAGFYVVDRALRWILRREAEGRRRTGLKGMGELASLPVMMLIVSAFLFVTLPIQSAYSRHLESEADQFALRAVADPGAGSRAFRKMAARNLSDPYPPALIEWFLYSHPAMGKRVDAAEAYAAARRSFAPS